MILGKVVAERYEVLKHIGQGGMQDVYLAKDLLLNSRVALKTPLPGQHARRFSQSAKIAARVNHHNVAKTLDYLELEGRLFLVEEYVPGDNLDVKLKAFGVLDPHIAARVFLHLTKGIAASHHAGVVHRDLKPSNIIVEGGVNLHKLKITDFGIATLAEGVFEDAAQKGELTLSNSGTIRGALPYMAPEMMFRNPGDNPGKPSDIWSLGALMFQLLTGDVPFGYYLQAAVNVQTNNRKAWPSFMSDKPQFSPLANQLKAVVDKCLTYKPESRPTADDLLNEISNLCFICVDRVEGRVSNLIQNGYSGFIDGDDGKKTFFSMESVYGEKKPNVSSDNKVCYSCFSGHPRDRGHPVVVIK